MTRHLPHLLALFSLLVLNACRSGLIDSGATDLDQDGHDSSVDCDDEDPAIHPDADEVCDGIDNDCDELIDDDDPDLADVPTWYLDNDGDGYGILEATWNTCSAPEGYVDEAGDCDDDDDTVYPGATEDDCTDPTDYDCDGLTEYEDEDGDGWAACVDCDDEDPAIHPEAEEYCDGIDNDCDGDTDEDDAVDAQTWYLDGDADGYGVQETTVQACQQPAGYAATDGDCDDTDTSYNPGAAEADCTDPNDYNCDGSVGYADDDSDGWAACVECDDSNSDINPDADEYCDGIDNDCDGEVDEDDALDVITWYIDYDGDGYGAAAYQLYQCEQPTGYVADDSDCDDTDAAVNPGAQETCNSIDDDCDGSVDEDDASDASTWYQDADGDGYGTTTSTTACDQPSGYAADDGDCDDGDSSVNPGAAEECDGADNDCDGDIDENPEGETVWYPDDDGDGYGDASGGTTTCSAPACGYGPDDPDCDDRDSSVNPDADEYCNGVDDDCDGETDEDDALDITTWYIDYDGDGYGATTYEQDACDQPTGYVADNTDCDDLEATTYPGASETEAGVDSNCDGTIDFPAPVAVASYNTTGTLYTCAEFELDGSNSYDPDGDPILTYSWTLESAPSGSIRDTDDIEETTDEAPIFVPDEEGDFTFGLVVSDGADDSSMDTLTLSVLYRGYNTAPVADAGTDNSYTDTVKCAATGYSYVCDDCATVVFALDGSGSADDDGDDLNYSWTITSGDSYASLTDEDTESPSLVVSGVPATFGSTDTQTIEVELEVDDCEGELDSDTVEIVFECTGA